MMDFLDRHKLKEKHGAKAFDAQEDLAFRMASEVIQNMKLDAIRKLGYRDNMLLMTPFIEQLMPLSQLMEMLRDNLAWIMLYNLRERGITGERPAPVPGEDGGE